MIQSRVLMVLMVCGLVGSIESSYTRKLLGASFVPYKKHIRTHIVDSEPAAFRPRIWFGSAAVGVLMFYSFQKTRAAKK